MSRLLIPLLFLASSSYANLVREIRTNEKTVERIFLNLGSSTVLRFESKPLRAVLGNSNNFNLEFTRNDITIQPLVPVSTNLFVYLEDQTFAFSLNFSRNADSLVLVERREPSAHAYRPPELQVRPVNQKILSGSDGAEVLLKKVTHLPGRALLLVDLELTGTGPPVRTTAWRDKKVFPTLSATVQPKQGIFLHRLAFKTTEAGPVKIEIRTSNKKFVLSLSQKDLKP